LTIGDGGREEDARSSGKSQLYLNDLVVAQSPMKNATGQDHVCGRRPLHRFRQRQRRESGVPDGRHVQGRTIQLVEVAVDKAQNLDLEMKSNGCFRDCLEWTWYRTRFKHRGKPAQREGTTMKNLRILLAAALGLLVMAHDATSQRRGGAVSGGVRGAVVGGMVGGSEGAETGARIGAVTGATRAAIDRETQARTQYQTTAEYQNAQRSNFTEVPPDVVGTTQADTATKPGGEAVIRKNGKPLVGITFLADWKQQVGDNYVSAVSKDGQAYAMLATLDKVPDKQAGLKQIKEGLERYLQDIKFDEPTETKGGALLITGTGKGKKAGVNVVFATGVIDAGNGQLVGVAFIVDEKIEDHYKETVRGICQTLRRAKDFAKE
jgi:hypothetical protein